jgi:hypothetical protein
VNCGGAAQHTQIAIGGTTIGVRAPDAAFIRMLERRYAGFVGSAREPDYTLEIDIVSPDDFALDAEVRVIRDGRRWKLERGDFRAEWEPAKRRGHIRQSTNPYSLDAVLRILHTLVLAPRGGFLVHASSALRDGKAFVFAGVSGAGKTTISRLAPPDAHVLTDEISYIRKQSGRYHAYGTPFAGDLGRPGTNVTAPLDTIYLLAQGPENGIDEIGAAEGARGLLACILFFANDPALVRTVFASALDLVERVPVKRLTFVPDARVWDLIG